MSVMVTEHEIGVFNTKTLIKKKRKERKIRFCLT